MRGNSGTLPAWIRAAHPLPGLTVTAVTAGLAASVGHSAAGTTAVSAAVLAGQLSVGWLNDAVDAARDARVGRTDKPVACGRLSRRAVTAAAVVAAVLSVVLSLAAGPGAGALHIGALASAWAYDLGVKATVWSLAPYAVSFGLLPGFVVLALPGPAGPPAWLLAGGSLLGCAAHFVNTLPDLADDLAVGVRGLPHRLGTAGSRVAAAVALLASASLMLGGSGFSPDGRLALLGGAVLTVAGGLLLGRRAGSRAAFHALVLVAAMDVGLLVTAGLPLGAA